jgi:serine/threonine protein kinase/Flp pilus assembly protein TadD
MPNREELMDHSHLSTMEREQLLDEIATAYLKAVEQGQAPDRREWLGQYPELAGELREFFAEQDRLERLARPLRVVATVVSPQGGDAGVCCPGMLGDFRIVRELGRGGMGVVFEAEQVSLRRRVALKVLPFAAMLDERLLQRFRNEAQAAAGLHHTNIVPVYFVGCERGVHFFAMQLIEGRTLAAVIHELRGNPGEPGTTVPGNRPGPEATGSVETVAAGLSTEGASRGKTYYRAVAELGVQVALALEHAHERGVIHRDIKPGNLLLDARGTPWVTDFGLAHLQHAEASLTMTGDLVGTLRYMSPEQALGKRVPIDHRTDVYSLGATLYELLTLRPAFTGSDRQELLRQIAFEEPPRPGRLDRRNPAELEIIVAKAMEKNPQDRYATAQELADDLRHFLEDRPIQARRPGWARRLAKLARRHRAVVATAAAGLVLAVAVLVGSIGWVAGERRGRQAETGRVVEAALADAEEWLRKDRPYEALSAALRAEGLLRQAGGHPGLQPQVDEMLWDIRLLLRLELARLSQSGIRGSFFDAKAADEDYEQAFAEFGLDVLSGSTAEAVKRIQERQIGMELAAFLDHWVHVRRNARGDGDAVWRKLLEVARQIDPDEGRARVRQAVARQDSKALTRLIETGGLDGLSARSLTSLPLGGLSPDALVQLVALLRRAQQQRPDDFWVNERLAYFLLHMRPRQLDEAIGFYRVAVALRPQSPGAHLNLGPALRAKGRLDDAIAASRKAIRLKKDFAQAHHNLGIALRERGRLDEAIAALREAIRLNKDLPQPHFSLGNAFKEKRRRDEAIAKYREAIRLKKDYAMAYLQLGIVLKEKGKLDEAIFAYRQAIRFKKDFGEDQGNVGIVLNNLGIALKDKGLLDEAIAAYRESIRIQKKDSASPYSNLGVALAAKGQREKAIAAFREALRIKKDLPDVHYNLGSVLEAQGKLEEAIQEYREALRIKKDDPEVHFVLGKALQAKGRRGEAIVAYREAIRLKKDHVIAYYNLGNALQEQDRLPEAEAAFRKASELQPDLAEAHCNLGQVLLRQGRFAAALAALNRGHGLGSPRPGWKYPSGEWVRTAEQHVDLDARLPLFLGGQAQPANAGEWIMLAQICQVHRQRYAAAVRFYWGAFKAQPGLAEDPYLQHRPNAAWAAALAGCGQGKDADQSDDRERVRLRHQSLAWLRADLVAYHRLLDKEPDKARPLVRGQLQLWQQGKAFACVRSAEALSRLPVEERAAWARLWADVADLLARTKETMPRDKEKPDKP